MRRVPAMTDSHSPKPAHTFLELYCERHQISLEAFDRHLLARALYPHARLVAPLLRAAWPAHFVADYDYLHAVALVRRMRDIPVEIDAFAHHPSNTGPLRRLLKLRVSSTRLQKLVHSTLHPKPEPDQAGASR